MIRGLHNSKPWLLGAALLGSCGIQETGLAPGAGGTGGLSSGSGGVGDSGWLDGSGGTILGGSGGLGATAGAGGTTDAGGVDTSLGGEAGVAGVGGVAGDSGTGGTTTWTPKVVPNCLLWLDAADSNAVSLVGTKVQIWTDKCAGHPVSASGNAKPSYVPALLNGLPGVQFDGVDDLLEIGGAAKASAAYVLFFVAANSKGATSQFPVWSNRHLPAAIANTATYFGLLGNHAFLYQNNAQVQSLNGASALATQPHVIELAVGALGRQMVVDGVPDSFDSTVVSTGTGLPAGLLASDSPNNQFGAFDLFEVVFYDRELSAAERTTIRNALKAKWALP